MDPAGPCFAKWLTSPVSDRFRLSSDDATVVDVIHTNEDSTGLGTYEKLGHYDFYPEFPDEGDILKSSFQRLAMLFNLPNKMHMHKYAYDLLIVNQTKYASLEPEELEKYQCHFVSYWCPDLEWFQQGRCAECSYDRSCQLMADVMTDGIPFTNTSNRKFFIKTGKTEPYCCNFF